MSGNSQRSAVARERALTRFATSTIYILLTTTSSIYEGVYGQNVAIASLHYIALMLGFMAASQGGARGLDVIYRRLKAKRGGQGKPEYRLPLGTPLWTRSL